MEMPASSTFGERFAAALEEWRKAKSPIRSKADFARAAKISEPAVAGYEKRGAKAPPAAKGAQLARALGVDVGWLLLGEATAAPSPDWWEVPVPAAAPAPYIQDDGRPYQAAPAVEQKKRKRGA